MGIQLTLTLVISLLPGIDPDISVASALENRKNCTNATIVVFLEKAKITLPPGANFNIQPVKTKQGTRVRLETSGVTVEADRLRIQCERTVYEVNGRNDNLLQIRTIQKGEIRLGRPFTITDPVGSKQKFEEKHS